MKTIRYKVKENSATTQYREHRPPDKRYVMDKLREIIELADGCIKAPEQSLATIGIKMKTPNKEIPRMGRMNGAKMNSIYSAAEGIVDNIENGTQRDFSNHTHKIIEKTFTEMQKIFADWEEVEFIEVSEWPKAENVIPTGGSMFEKLFDLSDYEMHVTFTKK